MNPTDFQALIVTPGQPLHEALQRLDSTGRGLLMVVDTEGRLLRTVSDRPRARRRHNEPADERREIESELLADPAPQRPAEQIDLRAAQTLDEFGHDGGEA